MIVCPVIKSTHSETDIMSWPENRISDVVKNAESVNQKQIPFYLIVVKKYQTWAREVGEEPYTGFVTILTLLEYPIKELYVSGFDFYQTEKVYADGMHNPLDGPEPKRGGGHGKTSKQIKYLNNIHQEVDKLYVDDKLQRIFERC